MAWSWKAGRAVPCDRMATFADGLAVRVAIPRAVEVLRRVVDRVELVSEREIARAVGRLASAGIRVEGAAAAGLAALSHLPEGAGRGRPRRHGPQHRRGALPPRPRAAGVLSGVSRRRRRLR